MPFLGFWSKPKTRLLRKPECRFAQLLEQHALRESIFSETDGSYVVIVFAWMELQDEKLERQANPVIGTLQKHLGGSHWILQFKDVRLAVLIEKSLPENQWSSFLSAIGISDDIDLEWESFNSARCFVRERFLELNEAEALLISVG